MSKIINYIDLFAGAGGLSEGFLADGYSPVAHVEMSEYACATLRTRICYYYCKNNNMMEKYNDYLRGVIKRKDLFNSVPSHLLDTVINDTMSNDTLPSIFEKIDNLKKENNISEVDLIIGGPPCQAYSIIGRSRQENGMHGDPRNYLYKLYCKFLSKYKPKAFVFENVPGLLSANNGLYLKNMQADFDKIGYRTDLNILDASEFGVLQKRCRIILIGWRKEENFSYPDFPKIIHKYTVKDLLSDLPSIKPSEENNKYKSTKYSNYLLEHGIRNHADVLTWNIARPHLNRDIEIYKRVITAWKTEHRRLKYTDLPSELCTHNNRTAFLDRFKVVADDLPACHTIVAHLSKDGHYFIHPDIEQARSITVREAARIQSFPDNYYFEGPRTAAFTQIGNAVPPVMANGIAKQIRKDFFKE